MSDVRPLLRLGATIFHRFTLSYGNRQGGRKPSPLIHHEHSAMYINTVLIPPAASGRAVQIFCNDYSYAGQINFCVSEGLLVSEYYYCGREYFMLSSLRWRAAHGAGSPGECGGTFGCGETEGGGGPQLNN